MSGLAIRAENIGKAYQLGEFSTGTLSQDIQRRIALMRGKEDPYLKIGEANDRVNKGEGNIVWSLKDISFDVKQGEAVGIIGRNGAGKSTLLKVLSRVTSPTQGSIKVKGRISSLLEVGTGFHPELTGKENIFLNGAILGMRRHEIKRKFDEIVEFAGVARYIDTPVKRYSSGMYVRLAFAVAAHLESEILIVDEVLAVGDAEFQNKCLGKMNDVSKGEGRTVLFVSHNMASIKTLCGSGILLRNGALHHSGEIDDVLSVYEKLQTAGSTKKLGEIDSRSGDGSFRFLDVEFINSHGINTKEFEVGENIEVKIRYGTNDNFEKTSYSFVNVDILDEYGTKIAWLSTHFFEEKVNQGENILVFKIKSFSLTQGNYRLNFYCETSNGIADFLEGASIISVAYNDFYGTGVKMPPKRGNVALDYKIIN